MTDKQFELEGDVVASIKTPGIKGAKALEPRPAAPRATVPCVHVVVCNGCNAGEVGYYTEAEVLAEERRPVPRFKVHPKAAAQWAKHTGKKTPEELAEQASEAAPTKPAKATRPRRTRKTRAATQPAAPSDEG